MRKSVKSRVLLFISSLLIFIFACQSLSPEEELPEIDDVPVQTATEVEATEPPSTDTPTPLPITIRVLMDDNLKNGEINVEVLEGDYQVEYGTTFRAGSTFWEEEQYLAFPVGLAIEVGPAGLTLKGKNYPEGTLLYVDKENHLMIVGETATETSGKPTSQMFRDDFTDSLQMGWEWRNEDPSRWEITPEGWLQIVGEDASLLADGAQSNLLCRDAPDDDFQVTVHLYADPREDFQQATLYLYQDGDNYVAINRGYCSLCETGGGGMFMEYKVAGSWEAFNVKTQEPDVFLRLVSQGQTVTGYYAFELGEWNLMGEAENSLADTLICVGVSNVDQAGINADLVGEFEYIEILKP